MIGMDAAELVEHQKRTGAVARTLLWVTARNRNTGNPESMGLWDGEDDQVFTIGGQERVYGGPALIDHDPIESGVGLDVRTVSVSVPHLSDAAVAMIRDYDPKLAPVEMHVAVFALETRALLAEPRRVFKGWIDEISVTTGEAGGLGEARVTLASASRALTRKTRLWRSHADQQRRDPNDRGREYSSVIGLREVPWGEGKVRNTASRAVSSSSPGGTNGGETIYDGGSDNRIGR